MMGKRMTCLVAIALMVCLLLPFAEADSVKMLTVEYDLWAERFLENLPAAGFEGDIPLEKRNTQIQGLLLYRAAVLQDKMELWVFVDEDSKRVMFANLKVLDYAELPEDEQEALLDDASHIMIAMIWASDAAFTEDDAREGFEACGFGALIEQGKKESLVHFKGVPCSFLLDKDTGDLSFTVGGNR